MNKIIFLDVDGVCNGYGRKVVGNPGIHKENVDRLNTIIDVLDIYFVISSAWRYLIINEKLTLKGFEEMLIENGLNCKDRVIGRTCIDGEERRVCSISSNGIHQYEEGIEGRGQQILKWIKDNKYEGKWLAIDDDAYDFRIDEMENHFVHTDGKIGIQDCDIERIKEIFGN